MASFSVIVFGVVVWTIAVSGANSSVFKLVWTEPKIVVWERNTFALKVNYSYIL